MVPLLRRLRRPCRARWAIQTLARQVSIALGVAECRDGQLCDDQLCLERARCYDLDV